MYPILSAGVLAISMGLGLFSKPEKIETVVSASQPKIVTMLATGYSIDKKQCGKTDGITATGRNGKLHFDGVASAWSLLPPGTKLLVPGMGQKVVDDTGGAMRRHARRGIYHIDIRFRSRKQAMAFGMKRLKIVILNPPNSL